ncbi:MAG: hypothetical protein R3D02_16770 [Hyphomicrobiales bacterium]
MISLMNGWWLAAAFFALVTATAHIVAGGREIAAPLLNAERLHPVVRYTHYFCWHMVSIVLVAMVVVFAAAASGQLSADLAKAATVLAVLFGLWNVALVASKGMSFKLMPQWALFAPVAVCGLAGWAL